MKSLESSQNKYFFILGSNPSLSVAELCAWFSSQGLAYKFIATLGDFVIVNFNKQLLVSALLQQLGGCIKFGKIISRLAYFPTTKDFKLNFSDTKKVYLGFSVYPSAQAKTNKQKLFKIGLELKKELKQQGLACRLVTSRETNLSAVVVAHNKLLTSQGKEFVILQSGNEFYIGETLEVQPFAEIGQRDYGRPARDSQSGMIPPKLAQMMLNLSQIAPEECLLDPFCGSGTIIQEAIWQGRQCIYGSDVSAKAVQDSQQNLLWLGEVFQKDLAGVHSILADIKQLPEVKDLPRFAAIVTEPDLGNPRLTFGKTGQEVIRLRTLYINAYKAFSSLLLPRGKVVMVWPVFFEKYDLHLDDDISALGFRKIEVLSSQLQQTYSLNQNNNLYYARENQKVGREITVWEKM
jgi:tRNA G10  N-methylase Trm11